MEPTSLSLFLGKWTPSQFSCHFDPDVFYRERNLNPAERKSEGLEGVLRTFGKMTEGLSQSDPLGKMTEREADGVHFTQLILGKWTPSL